MAKNKHTSPTGTLEEAIEKGYKVSPLAIGVSFNYLASGVLPLTLRVRVLSDDHEFISTAPYSLAFISHCCGAYLKEDYYDDEGMLRCRECEKEASWAPTSDPLSILGKRRNESFEYLSLALARLSETHPFTSVMKAADILDEIREAREKLLTPKWARTCAEAIEAASGKPVNYS